MATYNMGAGLPQSKDSEREAEREYPGRKPWFPGNLDSASSARLFIRSEPIN